MQFFPKYGNVEPLEYVGLTIDVFCFLNSNCFLYIHPALSFTMPSISNSDFDNGVLTMTLSLSTTICDVFALLVLITEYLIVDLPNCI